MLYYKTNLTFLSDFRIYLETPPERLPKGGGEIMEKQQEYYRILREAYEKRIGLRQETEEKRIQLYQEDLAKIDTHTPFEKKIQAGETLSGLLLKYLQTNGKQCTYKQSLLWIMVSNLAEQQMNVDHILPGDTVTIIGNLFSVQDAKGKIRSQVRIDALGKEHIVRLKNLTLFQKKEETIQSSSTPSTPEKKQQGPETQPKPPQTTSAPSSPKHAFVEPLRPPTDEKASENIPQSLWDRIEETPSADNNIHILSLHSPHPLTTLWRQSPHQETENKMLVGTSQEISTLLPDNKYDASNKGLVLRIDSITFHPKQDDPLDTLLKTSKRAEVKAIQSKGYCYLFVRGDNNPPLIIQFPVKDIHDILTSPSYTISIVGNNSSLPENINAGNIDNVYKSLQN
jgi:hypothetical protein